MGDLDKGVVDGERDYNETKTCCEGSTSSFWRQMMAVLYWTETTRMRLQ
jgi:hypothetical protein